MGGYKSDAPANLSSHEIPDNLSENAFECMRSWIMQGELEADSVLSERSLALRLGSSRTPIREAIGRLLGEGLLRRSGGAVIVNAVRADDIFEILSLRQLLEGEAIRLAIGKISDEQLGKLREKELALLEGQAVTSEDHWRVEDAFHSTIVAASGHQLLAKSIADLRELTRLYGFNRIPQRLEPGRQEHLAILDAMASKDADSACRLMHGHLQKVSDAIMRSLALMG